MANCEKILIAGFSGAGKSSLLKAAQKQAPAGWHHFEDLDQIIWENSGEDLPHLSAVIEKWGWEKFREAERAQLMEWVRSRGKGVLALGGGTLTTDTLESLAKVPALQIIHLHADFETCWSRLRDDSSQERPLVKKGKEFLQNLFQEREKVFSRLPQRIENPMDGDLDELARRFWSRCLDH